MLPALQLYLFCLLYIYSFLHSSVFGQLRIMISAALLTTVFVILMEVLVLMFSIIAACWVTYTVGFH